MKRAIRMGIIGVILAASGFVTQGRVANAASYTCIETIPGLTTYSFNSGRNLTGSYPKNGVTVTVVCALRH